MANAVKKATAEFFGTATLVCTVVGSGIMGAQLSSDLAVALIVNALATIFVLALLIFVLAPISGAHFNPAVSLVSLATGGQKLSETLIYLVSQVAGAVAGAMVANFMFDLPVIQIADQARFTPGTFFGEVIATAGLVTLIFVLVGRKQTSVIPIAVAGWIGAAYFFTSSTSFANPAVTIGRMFTDTFSGIAPGSVVPFILAQLLGAAVGWMASRLLLAAGKTASSS